nr:hypothetical protein [Tanacetum cinerariifolium]
VSRVNKEDNGVAEVLRIKWVLEKGGIRESGEVVLRLKLKKAQVTEKDNVQSKGPAEDNKGVAEVSRTTGLVNERKREDESKSESRSVLLESSRKPRELNRNMKLQPDQRRNKAMNVEAATLKNQKKCSLADSSCAK